MKVQDAKVGQTAGKPTLVEKHSNQLAGAILKQRASLRVSSCNTGEVTTTVHDGRKQSLPPATADGLKQM